MGKLPPEDELEPTHTLGGEPTDEDAPMPELEDYDSDGEPLEDSQDVEIEDDDAPEGDETEADQTDFERADGEEVE